MVVGRIGQGGAGENVGLWGVWVWGVRCGEDGKRVLVKMGTQVTKISSREASLQCVENCQSVQPFTLDPPHPIKALKK